MPLDDDLTATLAALGEGMTLAGQPITGLFDQAGEVVLDSLVTTATTARVPASAGAQAGQTLVHGATSYRVRQVLPVAPDGALVLLVLAKV